MNAEIKSSNPDDEVADLDDKLYYIYEEFQKYLDKTFPSRKLKAQVRTTPTGNVIYYATEGEVSLSQIQATKRSVE